MWYRQVKRFIRAKSRLVGSIASPLLWMFFFGVGFASTFNLPSTKEILGGVDYLSFLIPGIIMMTVYFASFVSGISIIWDREFGFLKEVLIAPTSRAVLIFGRSLGDSTVAVVQGLVILAIAYFLVPGLMITTLPLMVVSTFLVALFFTEMGIAIASRMRSMEGFQIVSTFVGLPILFLSGAFYPVDTLPFWMKVLAFINPLTYGVDIARKLLVGVGFFPLYINFLVLCVLTVTLTFIATWIFQRTTIE
ncbi:ABC transporter [Candidatus Bathyarchaeota archaeon]|nr:MAG: ABC transporter [Candidatus Bathyarchaeota archaeon]